jgi:PfaD family protein
MTTSGWWIEGDQPPLEGLQNLNEILERVNHPFVLIDSTEQPAIGTGGTVVIGKKPLQDTPAHRMIAYVPSLNPKNLGDPLFKETYRLTYPYVAGAMANGITSSRMVEEVSRAGMLGFFGAAGLCIEEIEAAIDRLRKNLGDKPFGFNLIHSPNEPELELQTARLYLEKGIRIISASAFLDLTPALVWYRIKGIYRNAKGRVVCPNKVVAKVSRVEVAEKFFSPAPEKILRVLLEKEWITPEEADLARYVPVAEDLTAEADSGGHTDNRPAIALLPTILALRDRMMKKYGYHRQICVGLGGGIATPESTAAAFSMGAAYVVTGSVNQSCIEAGTSETVRKMLSEAGQADMVMAPSADMFEMGVKVQVLKRGTMFAFRAFKLYDLFSRYPSLEEIPEKEARILEKDIFKKSLDEEWEHTRRFFAARDPKQIERAQEDPKHKMALVFRSYLGQSSTWANTGEPSRKIDYQIWCGPAIGAFNEWIRGSFLENPENRKTVTVAMNLLFGAAVLTRANWLRFQGVLLPNGLGYASPLPVDGIYQRLQDMP